MRSIHFAPSVSRKACSPSVLIPERATALTRPAVRFPHGCTASVQSQRCCILSFGFTTVLTWRCLALPLANRCSTTTLS
ncbi:hypothetical protein HMPREF9413_2186 [Paenibacillus sp. HGF7]|nr:hypothetical protein HMPREF9413_2186 [Paenibacillus sp. HGF7]